MKTLLTFLFLITATLASANSTQLQGNVVDTRHIPLSEATIMIYNADDDLFVKEVTTDVNGHFTVIDLPEGTYDLKVYFKGFLIEKSNDVSLSSKNAGSQNIDFYVTPEEEITLADTRTGKKRNL